MNSKRSALNTKRAFGLAKRMECAELAPAFASSVRPHNDGESGSGGKPHALHTLRAIFRTALKSALAVIVIATVTGCENVKPWQRGTLANYTMRADRDPIATAQQEHIFFSREMASGGRGVGGGGCGCN